MRSFAKSDDWQKQWEEKKGKQRLADVDEGRYFSRSGLPLPLPFAFGRYHFYTRYQYLLLLFFVEESKK